MISDMSSRFQLNQKRALRIAEPLQEDTKHSFHQPEKKKKKKKISSSKNGHLTSERKAIFYNFIRTWMEWMNVYSLLEYLSI